MRQEFEFYITNIFVINWESLFVSIILNNLATSLIAKLTKFKQKQLKKLKENQPASSDDEDSFESKNW